MKKDISVRAICTDMETWAPLGWAYDWDKSGLSIGDPNAQVQSVLVCLSVSRAVYTHALQDKVGMIISHHPLIWAPLTALRFDIPATRLCLDLAQAGIACYAAHTNLDAAPGGVNYALAERLGLQQLKPLFQMKHAALVKLVTFIPETHLIQLRAAVSAAGAGVIGEYTHCSFSTSGMGSFLPGANSNPYKGKPGLVNEEPECRFETILPKARLGRVLEALLKAHPYEEPAYDIVPLENADSQIGLGLQGILPKPLSARQFAALVRKRLGLRHLRVAGPENKEVSRVAVLGGAGGGEAAKLPPDIDAYVTGDVKYHDACAAQDRNLLLVDAGHHGTEQLIVPVIADRLQKHFPSLSIIPYAEPDPFRLS